MTVVASTVVRPHPSKRATVESRARQMAGISARHGASVRVATVPGGSNEGCIVLLRAHPDFRSAARSFQAVTSDPAFIEFIKDADVLVIHMTVGEDAQGFGAQLHAKPSVWGQMAAQGEVGRVVVSHIAANSTDVLQERVDVLQQNYRGPLTVGEDLLCVEVE